MLRQLGNGVLLCCAMFITANGKDDSTTEETNYQPPQRRKPGEPIPASNDTEYRFGNNSHLFTEGTQVNKKDFMQKINDHAYRRVECSDAGETRRVFDKALPAGWLYHHGLKGWRKYFDTSREERWVLPNVHCNKDRVLTAISWMRSGEGTYKEKDMAWRFREHTPPTYQQKINSLTGQGGVFCQGWQGWLFEKKKHYKEFIKTSTGDELFTMVNIYCDKERVTYMDTGSAGETGIGSQSENVLIYPFQAAPTPPATAGIGCAWQGWLLKDGTDRTWKDNGGKKRWSYEKYYAIDHRSNSHKDKFYMHGRVINPFCSKLKGDRHGKVTRIRAYCFYSAEWKKQSPCALW